MVALVAAATSGRTPISSMRGPFTMPPPTPNMPAMRPASEDSAGKSSVLRRLHSTSPSVHTYPDACFALKSRTRYARTCRTQHVTQLSSRTSLLH